MNIGLCRHDLQRFANGLRREYDVAEHRKSNDFACYIASMRIARIQSVDQNV